jgi:hypothetical protein
VVPYYVLLVLLEGCCCCCCCCCCLTAAAYHMLLPATAAGADPAPTTTKGESLAAAAPTFSGCGKATPAAATLTASPCTTCCERSASGVSGIRLRSSDPVKQAGNRPGQQEHEADPRDGRMHCRWMTAAVAAQVDEMYRRRAPDWQQMQRRHIDRSMQPVGPP